MKQTEAAVLCELSKPLEIWELTLPELRTGQVLVEIVYSGVCRSQLNEIHGYKGVDHYLPHTLGHEGSGIVRKTGQGVTKVSEGDHVILSWIKGAGIEAGGCHYTTHTQTVNSGPISTFLRYAVISENRLVAIPQEIPLREAALLGCAIPTGAGIVLNQLPLKKGESCAIFGAGGIGLSAILAAKFLGAHPIIAVDIHEDKLAQAQLVGASHCINSSCTDTLKIIQELTEGKGVKGAIESVGKAEAMELAFQATSSQGTCVVAGNLPKGRKIQIDPFDLILGKRILGSWGGNTQIDRDIPLYLPMILDKQLHADKLITHEVPLHQINTLFEKLERGEIGRGIVCFA